MTSKTLLPQVVLARVCVCMLTVSLVVLAGCDLGTVGGEDESLDGGVRLPFGNAGSYIGKYWITYYYLADQASYPGSGYPLYDTSCHLLASSTYAFYKAAAMEGSARLSSGRVINYAGSCTCGGRRRTCFTLLDASQPWGQGAHNNALIPLRSIAVDRRRISLGTSIYVKDWDGVYIPAVDGIGGFTHDGCFRADDTGGAVNGSHYDFFAGIPSMWKALEKIHGTKTHHSVYHGGTKCAYVLSLKPGGGGGGSGDGGSRDGGSGDGGSGDGGSGSDAYGDCYDQTLSGTCQLDSLPCSGGYKSYLCPGPADVRCCLSYGSCTYAGRTGTCQATSLACAGGYKSGLCRGPTSIRCCLPSWGSCKVNGLTGTCQLTSASCPGGYKSGLCPGPNDVKCCL